MNAFDAAKAACAAGEAAAALSALRAALAARPEYLQQMAGARLAEKIKALPGAQALVLPVRLAVLGSSTTAQLLPLLSLHTAAAGIALEIYDAPFGTYQQEILDPKSGLYAFKPQAALLFVNYRDSGAGSAEAEAERWAGLWKLLRERAGCTVLMSNFDAPVERSVGNLEAGMPEAGLGRLRRLNGLLSEKARGGAALILDADHLSACFGKERWHDARFWHHAKQAIALSALPRYAAEAAALLQASFGRSRKCLVLDLDNTLWGGVVGDDGVDGLDLGKTDRGEAFVAFQRYVKALKDRGVLLAVVSKNDEANAREPFAKRREMALTLDDISVFVANWEDKVTGLRAVARALNIGLDALAFADDNAAEREVVRRFCPEVAVIDLPEDPADYARVLDAARLFETAAVSKEDLARAAHFHAEASRAALQEKAPDLSSFLKDLDMRAAIVPFEDADVGRVAQLVNKTNQFNLTTRRTTEAEVRALIGERAARTLSVRLADRLGDYGLISVAVARRKGSDLEIETWLMSCRVLGRGVEKLVFNRLLELARADGADALVGRYLPTPKNGLVKDLYAGLGFEHRPDGTWRLPLSKARPQEVFIRDDAAAASRDA